MLLSLDPDLTEGDAVERLKQLVTSQLLIRCETVAHSRQPVRS
jgi:hypothetical protein